jgi:hypothetical protein
VNIGRVTPFGQQGLTRLTWPEAGANCGERDADVICVRLIAADAADDRL